jgi:hypothetical protein
MANPPQIFAKSAIFVRDDSIVTALISAANHLIKA